MSLRAKRISSPELADCHDGIDDGDKTDPGDVSSYDGSDRILSDDPISILGFAGGGAKRETETDGLVIETSIQRLRRCDIYYIKSVISAFQ